MLDDVHAQLEELTVLVGDLVELARDIPSSSTEELDFADIVDRALERVQRRAPGIRFAVDITSWSLVGERQSLERRCSTSWTTRRNGARPVAPSP